MSFSKYIKRIRDYNGLTQQELSEDLEISTTSIKKIEAGITKFPSKMLLDKLVEFTNSNEVDIAGEILFPEEFDFLDPIPPEEDDDYHVFTKYLVMMYLNGWNIESEPFYLPEFSDQQLCFAGKISKKRDPKNIVVIATYDEFTPYEAGGYLCKEAAFDILVKIVGITLCSNVECRKIQILFDMNREKDIHAYNTFCDFEISRIPIDIELVMFDHLSNYIVGTDSLKKKKAR